jgi:hypothetical protein
MFDWFDVGLSSIYPFRGFSTDFTAKRMKAAAVVMGCPTVLPTSAKRRILPISRLGKIPVESFARRPAAVAFSGMRFDQKNAAHGRKPS